MASQDNTTAPGLPDPYSLPPRNTGLGNPYASATVASAPPVRWTEEQAKAEQNKKIASRFHNPHAIKRPQAKNAAPAKRATMPVVSVTAQDASRVPSQQHSIEYYMSTAEDDASVLEEKRQREYEVRQRKKEQKKFQKQFGYWNPTAPHRADRYSNLKAYKASGGWERKKDAFNAFLRQAAEKSKSGEAGEAFDSSRPASSSSDKMPPPAMKKLSFAPPASYEPATAAPPANVQAAEQRAPPPPPPPERYPYPPPPPPARVVPAPPMSPAPITSVGAPYHGATSSATPDRYAHATISAPPVRYEYADVPMGDADEPAHNERPAKRPKISNAEAMMAKMGYVQGQGLGKNNDGVVTHLEVKKRKGQQQASTFDENGGQTKAQQVWDVSGGVRNQSDSPGKFGEESSVVVTWGCVDGIDWYKDAERNDGGIRQELGDFFSAKFGPVQRVHVNTNNEDGVVYVKFESVMSALNAVNRFDEGFKYRGRDIRAKYYDEKKWNAGIWWY